MVEARCFAFLCSHVHLCQFAHGADTSSSFVLVGMVLGLFCCCDETPGPKQLKEERVSLGLCSRGVRGHVGAEALEQRMGVAQEHNVKHMHEAKRAKGVRLFAFRAHFQ